MTVHYWNYCKIQTKVINKPKCLRFNKLILETGNKIKTVWRTMKLKTSEYSTEEEKKPVMMYANTIKIFKNLQHLVSVLRNSFSKTAY